MYNSIMKVIDTKTFILKAKDRHGETYDYRLVEWVNSKAKVTIICPKHGEFQQSPNNHLTGYGCKECGKESVRNSKLKDSKHFINKAISIHGDKYDYSNVRYKGTDHKVYIICNIHGPFKMTPGNHTNKTRPQGCPECGLEARLSKRRLPESDILKSFRSVHGNYYDYSKVVYSGYHEKIKIVCPLHGEFYQTPAHHIKCGNGCPSCAKYGFDPESSAILYYIKINDGEVYKIGITNRSVEERFKIPDLKKLEVVKTWYFDKGRDARHYEKKILNNLNDHRYNGEPILTSGNTELFIKDISEEIETILKELQ